MSEQKAFEQELRGDADTSAQLALMRFGYIASGHWIEYTLDEQAIATRIVGAVADWNALRLKGILG